MTEFSNKHEILGPVAMCECHATTLFGASERMDLVFAIIAFHTTPKGVLWDKIHYLRENQFAVIHDI